MKRHYEKLLEKVLNDYYSGNKREATIEELNISIRDAEFLTAKGFCSMPYTLDGVFCLAPTRSGLTYFEDKRESIKSLIAHWSFNFTMALLSAVFGGLATLLMQHAFF